MDEHPQHNAVRVTVPNEIFDLARGASDFHTVASQIAASLPDRPVEDVLAVRDAACQVGETAWALVCAADAVLVSKLRSRAALSLVATDRGESTRTLYRNAQVYDQLLTNPETADLTGILRDKTYFSVAVEAPDPVQAIALMAERKTNNPAYGVSDARRDVVMLRHQALSARYTDPGSIPGSGYQIIVADPPWTYDEGAVAPVNDASTQYPTMTTSEICRLPVADRCADDALLYLWSTGPKTEESLQVLNAWGFRYVSQMVWVKDRLGMGYYARAKHELVLIGRRGDFPTPAPDVRPDSVLEAPYRGHSVKPDEFYALVERAYPWAKKLELFARRPRENWTAWGNQVESEAAA